MRTLLIAIVVLGFVGTAAAQEAKFDVASVRQCKDENDIGPGRLIISGERLQLPCFLVIQMISMAYGTSVAGQWSRFPTSAIEGGPAWLHELVRFTVEAKVDRNVGEDIVRGPMLRALLEERFHLRARMETRQAPSFGLTVASRGPKLKPFDGTCTPWDAANSEASASGKPRCTMTYAGRGWIRNFDFRGISMATLAQQLSQGNDLPGPVVDRTGIEGRFDVHLEYDGQQDAPPDASVTVPQLPAALEEQLGLRLEKTTTPRPFLVIENLERPTAN